MPDAASPLCSKRAARPRFVGSGASAEQRALAAAKLKEGRASPQTGAERHWLRRAQVTGQRLTFNTYVLQELEARQGM
eukprot:gene11424-14269_t